MRAKAPALDPVLARTLARISADEIVAALSLARAPAPVRAAVRAAFWQVSRPLGRVLARFDARVDALGIARAADAALGDLEATWRREGEPVPPEGAVLVVANHPGAYDALTLLAAIGRDDARIVAAERLFLRAMPAFARHLCFVADSASAPTLGRSHGLRGALRHLREGGALLQFGAGRIEPDPAFPVEGPALATWAAGTGALVRAAAAARGCVVPALVEGVHSPGAKRLWLTRLAERRGVTTIAALLQIAMRRYHDVAALVRFGAPLPAAELAVGSDDLAIAARVRDRTLGLWRSRG